MAKAPKPKIEVPPLVHAYLEALADLGVYGDSAGRVAVFILRKEIMRLLESKRIDPIAKSLVERLREPTVPDEEDEDVSS